MSATPFVHLRPVTPADAPVWEELRTAHWPDGAADYANEIASFFAGTLEEPTAVMLAEEPGNIAIALLELSLRTDIPGLEGRQVGYVEGLYIRPKARGRGLARHLLQKSRNWHASKAAHTSPATAPAASSSIHYSEQNEEGRFF